MAKKRRTTPPPPPPRGPRYDWSPQPQAFLNADQADPQVIGLTLDQIAQAHGGRLQPEHVVEAARAPRHPFHRHFPWDDAVAAAQHRLDIARRITRSVVLLPDDPKSNQPPKRAWTSVSEPNNGVSYRRVDQIMRQADLQLAVMRRALADLRGWLERYRSLQDLCGSPVSQAAQHLATQIEIIVEEAERRSSRESEPV
jgi:hypothetical protein